VEGIRLWSDTRNSASSCATVGSCSPTEQKNASESVPIMVIVDEVMGMVFLLVKDSRLRGNDGT
jgi:hypothetical protein